MGELDLKPEGVFVQESLAKKVLHGGFWVITQRIVVGGLCSVRLLILARLLAPNDFGLLGFALLTLSI
ncbi:MAG: hypothetical protein ABIA66_04110, partial [Candidatus Omnitrophota bacterium]